VLVEVAAAADDELQRCSRPLLIPHFELAVAVSISFYDRSVADLYLEISVSLTSYAHFYAAHIGDG